MKKQNTRALKQAAARLQAKYLGVSFALLGGGLVLLMTVWLLIKGGENVGTHLSLLSHFFPGYSVSWPGSIVGFLWGAIYGGVFGFLVGWLYNRIVRLF
jgi:hypothetical protein